MYKDEIGKPNYETGYRMKAPSLLMYMMGEFEQVIFFVLYP